MKRYYKAKISDNLDFKFFTDSGKDANMLVRNWAADQNKGEMKSDRISVKSVKHMNEKEYNECPYPEMNYRIF